MKNAMIFTNFIKQARVYLFKIFCQKKNKPRVKKFKVLKNYMKFAERQNFLI